MHRILRHLSLAFLCAVFAINAPAQYQPFAGPGSANAVPADALEQPAELNALLDKPHHAPVLILQVGSRMLFAQAHIPGSEYIGPGSQGAGLDLLNQRVQSVPRSQLIVLYCGCCPWDRCPNIAPAFNRLHELGFKNAKVLYLAHNFGADWVEKGYHVER